MFSASSFLLVAGKKTMLSMVWISSSWTTHLISSPANSFWSETSVEGKKRKCSDMSIWGKNWLWRGTKKQQWQLNVSITSQKQMCCRTAEIFISASVLPFPGFCSERLSDRIWVCAGCECCVLTSIGFALPGVIAGHLAVSSLRQSSVIAALGLAVKISVLETYRMAVHMLVSYVWYGGLVSRKYKGPFIG